MYGQTEATARMAYLPPDLARVPPGSPSAARSRADRSGLDPLPDWPARPDTGELVYTGPNVMLGYAESPADLRLGRTVDELRTGDIARRGADGLYEIVGRRSRLREDPRPADRPAPGRGDAGRARGHRRCASARDDELVVAVSLAATRGGSAGCVDAARAACRRGRSACTLLPDLPRLATGSPTTGPSVR